MSVKHRFQKSGLKEHITGKNLLKFLQAGLVLTVALTAPNALRIFKSQRKEDDQWNDYYPSSLERSVIRLWRKGYVEIKEAESGYQVLITGKGKTLILKYDLNAMHISKPNRWDGKWRMVFFDIPASERVRHVFRKQLRELGLFQMQESVYIYPYPCEKEIYFLREVYSIPHNVKLALVEKLENDEDLRRIFHLE